MKTALTEWFDELKANYPYMANEIFDKGFNKYLEKEKEQIQKAHINGQSEFDMLGYRGINETLSENYFNETYNQNK